jgi:hypothetical protein
MNVLEYETKLEQPIKRKQVCLKCANPFSLKNNESPNFCTQCGQPIKEEWDKSASYYKENMQAYRDDEKRLLDEFKSDALIETGLSHHKKGYLALELAWERGHSEGLRRVLEELKLLADLMVE